MYTAFFDASGTRRNEAITMAGYVSDVKKWAKFEVTWNRILEREKVSSFHMTDFASKQKEYKGWDQERRVRFLGDLVDCAGKYTNKAFSATVVLADFQEIDRTYCLHEALGQPYSVVGRSCVGYVKKWARKHHVKQVGFAFERGDEDWKDFKRVCQEQEKIEATSYSKKDFVQFQAADLLAWKSRYPVRRVLSDDLEETVEELQRLLSMVGDLKRTPYISGVFNSESFTNICIKGSIPLR
jgi:vacuolar-type H+-ATPase subunit I/STV1